MSVNFNIVIPARLASTRLERKLLKEINGKTIIQRTWERSKSTKANSVVVATDSKEIYEHIKEIGGVPFLSGKDHSSGTDRICEYVESTSMGDDELVINLQADEPLIDVDAVNNLAEFMSVNLHPYATICKKFNQDDNIDDENRVKVVFDNNGRALYFSRAKIPFSAEEGTEMFHHIGVYGYKVSFLKKFSSLPNSKLEKIEKLEQLRALENGYDIHVLEVKTFEAWGIDTPEDLEKFRNHITEIESN